MLVVGKRILVKQTLTDSVSKGGIVMSGNQEALPYGTVVQVGPNFPDDCVKVDDIVLFTSIAAIPLGLKKHHVLVESEDILAILSEEDVKNAGT